MAPAEIGAISAAVSAALAALSATINAIGVRRSSTPYVWIDQRTIQKKLTHDCEIWIRIHNGGKGDAFDIRVSVRGDRDERAASTGPFGPLTTGKAIPADGVEPITYQLVGPLEGTSVVARYQDALGRQWEVEAPLARTGTRRQARRLRRGRRDFWREKPSW